MKKFYFALGLLLIFCAYFFLQIVAEAQPLRVIFLDVGQGDSVLIQKGTKQILIDGGPSGKKELAELGKYLPYFDREIEMIIVTHPDKDHLAGLIDVARNYKIDQVFATAAEKDTQVFKEWKDVLSYNKINIIEPIRGTEIDLGEAKMRIIDPPGAVAAGSGDGNNSSVVAKLDYMGNSFLFTGDIESGAEKEILSSGENIKADILKVAHHGSKYSSTDEFLDAVDPRQAVISVGAGNSYGHPHDETIQKLGDRSIQILRTDETSDIEYDCAGGHCRNVAKNWFFGI